MAGKFNLHFGCRYHLPRAESPLVALLYLFDLPHPLPSRMIRQRGSCKQCKRSCCRRARRVPLVNRPAAREVGAKVCLDETMSQLIGFASSWIHEPHPLCPAQLIRARGSVLPCTFQTAKDVRKRPYPSMAFSALCTRSNAKVWSLSSSLQNSS